MNKTPELLKKVPFFSGLSEADLTMVAGVMCEKTYSKGALIFLEGEPGEALFVIKQGRVKISKSTADGREQILHILKDGDIFAEVVLFDQGPYPATAEAVEDTTSWLLRNEEMEKLLQSHPLLAIKLLRVMSKRLRQSQLLIRDLALHDTYGRLAGLLIRFIRREGKRTADGVILDLELTRQEMASMIGTSRETVARILSRFQKDGILILDKQRIVIIDEEKLRDWT
ncbi:MAG: Crp/Fnr family transcriptional regulator [Clostridiales bacterium]|jgi:CRP/FNR family transcriptional regulator|nr:Crp/Fnr family transcriptional regulator [Clostridiales bacterium]